MQVPQPGAAGSGAETRLDRVLAVLSATPGVAGAHALTEAELADLLRPWLGSGAERLSIPLPAVIAVHLAGPAPPSRTSWRAQLDSAAPGTLIESHGVWVRRLGRAGAQPAGLRLGRARRGGGGRCRGGRGGDPRRAGGAAGGDRDRAWAGRHRRLHRRPLRPPRHRLAAVGGLVGALAALPVLLALAWLAAPVRAAPGRGHLTDCPDCAALATLPAPLWLALPALPLAAAAIGFLTAQGTVRRWLRRLP